MRRSANRDPRAQNYIQYIGAVTGDLTPVTPTRRILINSMFEIDAEHGRNKCWQKFKTQIDVGHVEVRVSVVYLSPR